jgi:hypothetical protein
MKLTKQEKDGSKIPREWKMSKLRNWPFFRINMIKITTNIKESQPSLISKRENYKIDLEMLKSITKTKDKEMFKKNKLNSLSQKCKCNMRNRTRVSKNKN